MALVSLRCSGGGAMCSVSVAGIDLHCVQSSMQLRRWNLKDKSKRKL
ncbi:hypothetical protein Patl1_07513 [Pistacia atlantica]|uniref:Uncharacterized protein n=1 Tax=Pistacia atlantica TaxID=434234 RepID=A0ACC1AIR2_9ROSI|nr:hypothetical protein Patl1_07513 [Pistacia atlantica]